MSQLPTSNRRRRSTPHKYLLAGATLIGLAVMIVSIIGGAHWVFRQVRVGWADARHEEQVQHGVNPYSCRVEFSPDGRRLLIVGEKLHSAAPELPSIRCDEFDAQTGRRQFRTEFVGSITDLGRMTSYASDGSHLLVQSTEGVASYMPNAGTSSASGPESVFVGLYVGGIAGPVGGKYLAHTSRGLITYDPRIDGGDDEAAGDRLESCLGSTFAELMPTTTATATHGKPRVKLRANFHQSNFSLREEMAGIPTQIEISRDGHSALTVESVGKMAGLYRVMYWDVDGRRERPRLALPSTEMAGASCVKAGYGSSGPLILIGRDLNKLAIVWDPAAQSRVATITFDGSCSDLAASYADGNVVVAGIATTTGTVSIYDGRSGRRVAQWVAPPLAD